MIPCVLRMEDPRREKGRYVDTLIIKTDSPLKPEIQIYVIGMINRSEKALQRH